MEKLINDFLNKNPIIDETCFVSKDASLIGDVRIGTGANIWYKVVLRADVASIVVGENSNIQDASVCHVDFDKPVIVGKNVTVGHGVILHGCSVGDNSLIGMGAIVLDGARIGNNCIVGAGALVLQNTVIPDNSLVLGSPAKVKKQLSDEDIAKVIENANLYVKLAKAHKGKNYGK